MPELTDVDDMVFEEAAQDLSELIINLMKDFNIPRAHAKALIEEAANLVL